MRRHNIQYLGGSGLLRQTFPAEKLSNQTLVLWITDAVSHETLWILLLMFTKHYENVNLTDLVDGGHEDCKIGSKLNY